ncbi:MAG: hypothetical protein KKF44_06305 [Nanoarchaeota archaeon]|nr:hypothetical protein [Nanoarchaeota archaeon]
MKKRILVIIAVLTIILVLGVIFYYFVLSSATAKKPILEKPEITEMDKNSKVIEVKEEVIDYVSNELGAYKLHSDPATGNIPEIEFIVSDTKEIFTVMVIDGITKTEKGEAVKPDIRLTASKDILFQLVESDDFERAIYDMVSESKVGIQILADEKTLALKGYKAIYDTISAAASEGNMLTGNAVSKLAIVEFTGITKLGILLTLFLILELFFFYEKVNN